MSCFGSRIWGCSLGIVKAMKTGMGTWSGGCIGLIGATTRLQGCTGCRVLGYGPFMGVSIYIYMQRLPGLGERGFFEVFALSVKCTPM